MFYHVLELRLKTVDFTNQMEPVVYNPLKGVDVSYNRQVYSLPF